MVLQNYITNLPDLISLSFALFRLEINDLFNVFADKNVMAALYPLIKAKRYKQSSEVVKIDICVRVPSRIRSRILSALDISNGGQFTASLL